MAALKFLSTWLVYSRMSVPRLSMLPCISRGHHLPSYQTTSTAISYTYRQPIACLCTDSTKNTKSTKSKKKTVKVTFVDRDGDVHTVDAKLGDSLLEVAKEYDIDLEGACDGTLSCSTCHLIVDQEWFDKIPDPLTEEEQDMLDLAYGLTDTSRLGCQILVSKAIDGIKLRVPTETRDIRDNL